MPLPVSGAISFNAINIELNVAGTTQASLNQASYRTLADVPSGQISLSNFYGKANQFLFTISSPQTNANLRTLAVNAGWPGSNQVIATISPGVVVGSNSTGVSALTISGAFPNGVQLNNSGTIVGRGGNGGPGPPGGAPTSTGGTPGGGGGPALAVSVAVTLNNTGTIAGGGGGGGGGSSLRAKETNFGGAGGGGGRSSLTNSSGGTGGSGSPGGTPGGAGTFSAAGTGGTGASPSNPGGPGGNFGAAGNRNTAGTFTGLGGPAGSAISGNPNITYISTGTRLGPIS